MKKLFMTLVMISCLSLNSFGWGQTGHRVVGQLAEWNLTKKAEKRIEAILGPESLAMVANWMDEIKSDDRYNHLDSWHYLTVETGYQYDPTIQEKEGDAYGKTNMIIEELTKGGLSIAQEQEYLKMLIHLVGDLHQPLHVGKGDDRGGNDVSVTFFRQKSNLHKVWDSDLIDSKRLSYTELAQHLQLKADARYIYELQSTERSEWLKEAVALRPLVYDLPDNNLISYEYGYKNFSIIEERLLAAGIRLAGILNEIYN